MEQIAGILDEQQPGQPHGESVRKHRAAVTDPEQTLAAKTLRDMRAQGQSFAEYALHLSHQHAAHWRSTPLRKDRAEAFQLEAETSWREQRRIEAADTLSFDEFLRNYLAQK
jgi:glutamate--cysteine ligase